MKFLEGYKTYIASALAFIVIGAAGVGLIPVSIAVYILGLIGAVVPAFLRSAITTEAAKAVDAAAKRP